MFNKRPKARPGSRQRIQDDERDTPDGANETAEPSPSTHAAKLKKSSKPKTRLSFGAEDGSVRGPLSTVASLKSFQESSEPAFQLKKSKLSQQLALGKQSQCVAFILA